MKTKQEFAEKWNSYTLVNNPAMRTDALAVINALQAENEALEAQIPKARYKVGDRVKTKFGNVYTVSDVLNAYYLEGPHNTKATLAEDELEPAPIEPPTVEECIEAISALDVGETTTQMECLIARYNAWKESQNA